MPPHQHYTHCFNYLDYLHRYSPYKPAKSNLFGTCTIKQTRAELLDTQSHNKPYYDLREDNAHVLDYQINQLFVAARRMGNVNPYPKPVYRPNENRPPITATAAYLNERVPVSDVELFNPGSP